ncbi:hypothetical protein [Paenibacillus sp. IHBB 10380]|uniref:hypothetical protein n=1 Tax=Paenibacillus sp. IHBB 10380 TaxID=1566358 RepID=UPI0005CFB025|nr:hypothetical protein [Paenibacillus sp. IHBB 10380]AJS60913.1 hypothetical protein UB51_23425 [Paenibacillus sp. IHBB 10380]
MQLMIAELERKIENPRHYFTNTWDASDEAAHGNPVARPRTMIEHVFKPPYFINPIEEKQHPNLGQIYDRLQITINYSSRETNRMKKKDMIKSAQQAFSVKGVAHISSLYDYSIYYLNE